MNFLIYHIRLFGRLQETRNISPNQWYETGREGVGFLTTPRSCANKAWEQQWGWNLKPPTVLYGFLCCGLRMTDNFINISGRKINTSSDLFASTDSEPTMTLPDGPCSLTSSALTFSSEQSKSERHYRLSLRYYVLIHIHM